MRSAPAIVALLGLRIADCGLRTTSSIIGGALLRSSVELPALTAAWILTSEGLYATHARRHLRAWFIDAAGEVIRNSFVRQPLLWLER